MRSSLYFALILALGAAACSSSAQEQAPAPAISTSAADNLIPGQLARGAALQTEIRSAGHDCNKVVRTFWVKKTQDRVDVAPAEKSPADSLLVASRLHTAAAAGAPAKKKKKSKS